MPKKVLIIAYYWPPSGGAGVQRWVKFVKYLKDFNWEPVVYTPKDNEMPIEDNSLLADIPEDLTIIRRKIWEPYKLFKFFVGAKKNEKFYTGGFIYQKKKAGLAQKIAIFVRGNLFIPDARKFWIRPSVKFLKNYLNTNPVDLIITTGPPHSMHLIGKRLKKLTNILWIADFRDPWTKIYFYKDFMLTRWADKKHHKLEKQVLTESNHIITVGNKIKSELEELGGKKVSVISNGYDEVDINTKNEISLDKGFSIVHTGNISKTKNQTMLWKVLGELKNEIEGFKDNLRIKLAGQIDYSACQDIEMNGLNDNTEYLGYLSHDKVIPLQKSAQILLLIISNTKHAGSVITGKVFEYMAVKRPILAITTLQGELANLITTANAGTVIEFEDYETLKKTIIHLYQKYLKNELIVDSKGVNAYSRRNLTKELVQIMDDLVTRK